MKKIINGKMYNTKTATCIEEWNNGRNWTDFYHCSETLYKKTTGEFFLHGEGGAASQYSTSNGNSSSGSEEIIPFTEDEARTWLEEKGNADVFEATFGEVAE